MDATERLEIPITRGQIDAATEFWAFDWESEEFEMLNRAFPGRLEAVSIKAIVVNELYSTNIFAIKKAAECVLVVLAASESTGPDLVEQLVDGIENVTKRRNYSFASKYAHFFVNSGLPILDGYAEWMVAKHIGRKLQSKEPNRYRRFIEDCETLRRIAGLNHDFTELDKYLWVAGEYWYWKAHPRTNINTDLKRLFKEYEMNPANQPKLAKILGCT